MRKEFKIFSSVWFVLGLSLLLLNDLILKDLFNNWFTGKLSDFAGLFVFVLFWTAIIPKYKKFIFGITATIFILWKSSFSQPFIETWNDLGLLPIDRVVDLTDLMALVVLPVAYNLERRSTQLKTIHIPPAIPVVLSAFAFAATSYSTNEQINKSYEVDVNKDTLINRLENLDSVNVLSKNYTSDTFDLSIENELCHDRINLKLTVVKVNDSTSSITLLNATHPCPKKNIDKQDIMDAFEKRTINKIND